MFIEKEKIILVKRQLESELVHKKGDCDRYCISKYTQLVQDLDLPMFNPNFISRLNPVFLCSR